MRLRLLAKPQNPSVAFSCERTGLGPFHGRGVGSEVARTRGSGGRSSGARRGDVKSDHFEPALWGFIGPGSWLRRMGAASRKIHWEIACITVMNAAKRLVHPFTTYHLPFTIYHLPSTIYSGTTTLAILHENTEPARKLMDGEAAV